MTQKQKKIHQTLFRRKVNKHSVADFQLKLSYETWEPVFDGNDINTIFNVF
jgi:hypothetical protein